MFLTDNQFDNQGVKKYTGESTLIIDSAYLTHKKGINPHQTYFDSIFRA
jgi:hypothetical protein